MDTPRIWYDADSNKLTGSDSETFAWIKSRYQDRYAENDLFIGTDSHLHGREFRFVSVLCVYTRGKGGNYRYTLTYQPRTLYKGNQQARMFHEVSLSIDLANLLVDKMGIIPVIHIDASPKHKGEFTSAFSDSLKGYVAGSGFECELKDGYYGALAANAVADRHTK